jgi:hypothetical protein
MDTSDILSSPMKPLNSATDENTQTNAQRLMRTNSGKRSASQVSEMNQEDTTSQVKTADVDAEETDGPQIKRSNSTGNETNNGRSSSRGRSRLAASLNGLLSALSSST